MVSFTHKYKAFKVVRLINFFPSPCFVSLPLFLKVVGKQEQISIFSKKTSHKWVKYVNANLDLGFLRSKLYLRI